MEVGPLGPGVLQGPVNLVLPTLACLFSSLRDNRGYNGYQVLRVNATSLTAYGAMSNIFINDNFDFWSPPSRINPTDIMVCPEQVDNLKFLLGLLRMPYEVMMTNVATAIQREQVSLVKRQSPTMNWETYQKLSTIQDWMARLAADYPNLVSVLTIGQSTEGKPLQVLKISTGGADSKKPVIWMDGGIHAREWVSPAVVTYMANQLIQQANQDPKYNLVDKFDWYIMPNVNPDGYEYSHTEDRMWRKTRSEQKNFVASFLKCKGVDPNRNFAHKWGGKGTSNYPCSETYKGPSAASEPEIASVQKFVYENREQIKLFLTFHSYSQMLFLPWGYDNVRVPDHDELMVVANKAAKSLEDVYGTKYQVGPSPELLYAAAGGSEDFAKGIANIKYAYCFELRDTGKYGFILPSDQIIPSGIETFAAVKSMAEDMIQIYNLNEASGQNVENPPPSA